MSEPLWDDDYAPKTEAEPDWRIEAEEPGEDPAEGPFEGDEGTRRKARVRGRTESIKRLSKRELERGRITNPDLDVPRPVTRADCLQGVNAARPCPFVSCVHHLFLDVSPKSGAIKYNFPDLQVWEMEQTCALDVADQQGVTLEEVGSLMNLTRERIRQLETRGVERLKAFDKDLGAFLDDGEEVFRPAAKAKPEPVVHGPRLTQVRTAVVRLRGPEAAAIFDAQSFRTLRGRGKMPLPNAERGETGVDSTVLLNYRTLLGKYGTPEAVAEACAVPVERLRALDNGVCAADVKSALAREVAAAESALVAAPPPDPRLACAADREAASAASVELLRRHGTLRDVARAVHLSVEELGRLHAGRGSMRACETVLKRAVAAATPAEIEALSRPAPPAVSADAGLVFDDPTRRLLAHDRTLLTNMLALCGDPSVLGRTLCIPVEVIEGVREGTRVFTDAQRDKFADPNLPRVLWTAQMTSRPMGKAPSVAPVVLPRSVRPAPLPKAEPPMPPAVVVAAPPPPRAPAHDPAPVWTAPEPVVLPPVTVTRRRAPVAPEVVEVEPAAAPAPATTPEPQAPPTPEAPAQVAPAPPSPLVQRARAAYESLLAKHRTQTRVSVLCEVSVGSLANLRAGRAGDAVCERVLSRFEKEQDPAPKVAASRPTPLRAPLGARIGARMAQKPEARAVDPAPVAPPPPTTPEKSSSRAVCVSRKTLLAAYRILQRQSSPEAKALALDLSAALLGEEA